MAPPPTLPLGAIVQTRFSTLYLNFNIKMKKTLLFFALLIVYSTMFGQSNSDSITVKNVFGGYKFFQNDKQLTMSQVGIILQQNEFAYKEFTKAKSTNTIASIIGGIGGFMIGYPLGTAMAGGKANWTMAGIGAGLVLVSIPITNNYKKQAKSAIDSYNNRQKTSSFFIDTEINLAVTGNNIGFRMTF